MAGARRRPGGPWPGGSNADFVVEKALVHRPELLDTQIAIRHALAGTAWRRSRRQREHHLAHVAVRQRPSLEKRRACRRKEAAVERGHTQIAGLAPVVREARDGLKRLPEAARRSGALGRGAQRFHRVGRPVHRVPLGTRPRASAKQRNRMR